MMSAKEMFGELGYQRNVENEKIIYLIETKGSFYYQEIIFNLLQKVIVIDGNFLDVAIENNLLKAINKQVEELHWLDEKTEIKEARNPEVTNLEYYKDEILENCLESLAVVKGRPKLCYKTSCNDCDFKINQKECHNKVKDWLKQIHKKPTYKLTQFEYDLLQHFSVDFKFKEMGLLKEMKEKGHFKNINGDELIKDILESCEVIK